MHLNYNRKLRDRSRKLREASTLSEVLLWNELKARKLGHQFLRQKPLGNYIVDFYCLELSLVIEIDGSSHDSKQDYDQFRDEYLDLTGLHVMKFLDVDVKSNLQGVVYAIRKYIHTVSNTARVTKSPL